MFADRKDAGRQLAAGLHYRQFPQLTDEHVLDALKQAENIDTSG